MSTPDLRSRTRAAARPAEVAVRQDSNVPVLQSKMDYAKVLATSGMLPKQYQGNPANLLWAIEYGEMLGLSPMAAVTGVHLIEGKPSASAHLIAALIRRAGHKLRVSSDPEKAVAQIVRRDDPEFVFRAEWTMGRAQRAGLTNKDNWKKYGAQMLEARAIAEVGRKACSDVLMGLYTPDELGEDWEGGFVVEADPVADTTSGEIAEPPAATWSEPAKPADHEIADPADFGGEA